MFGKRFSFKVQKRLFLLKLSIQNDEMQDFECFLQNYGYENKKSLDFLIKNNKHYLFLGGKFYGILVKKFV